MRTRSENLQGDGEEVTLQRQAVQVGIIVAKERIERRK